MTRLPIEPDVRGMQRRNILVEQNRCRVAKYEPVRKILQEQDVHALQRQAAEKEAIRKEFGMMSSTQGNATGSRNRRHSRPMPGAAARAQHESEMSDYVLEAKLEAQRRAEYHKYYEADMQQQLSARRMVLAKMKADEAAHNAALKAVIQEREQLISEAEARAAQAQKETDEKYRDANLRMKRQKEAEAEAEAVRESERIRFLTEQDRQKAERDVRQARDARIRVQMEIGEYYAEVVAKQSAQKTQDVSLIQELIARDQMLAEEEKKKRAERVSNYTRELDESVEREKKYRQENNYDEPVEVARERMLRAAQSHRIMEAEKRRRNAAQKLEYARELIEQVHQKHNYKMSHLDEV